MQVHTTRCVHRQRIGTTISRQPRAPAVVVQGTSSTTYLRARPRMLSSPPPDDHHQLLPLRTTFVAKMLYFGNLLYSTIAVSSHHRASSHANQTRLR